MYGIPFPRPLERIERLREAVQVIQELWHKDVANFKGKYYALTNAVLNFKTNIRETAPTNLDRRQREEASAVPVVSKIRRRLQYGPCSLEVYAHKVSILKNCCGKLKRQSQMKLSYAGRILLVKPRTHLE